MPASHSRTVRRRDCGSEGERRRLLAQFERARHQLETAAVLREIGGCGTLSDKAVALAIAMLERKARVPTAGSA